ncbi:CU044_5270 family protein [Thermomonospora umbrina]|uniref:CU044_5270 family protein n=1 Tax=Thermomonospora umbrina TaxID=111806 RepID=A0A3D9SS74_9ACTN|nr:CU044_5270 family protein [Thermomonospora umbrina]REE98816.1 hypothetical protein DFJ69_4314 [Thermomonospora umbrina]
MDEVRMVRDRYPEPAPPTAQEISRARALLNDPPRRSRPRLKWVAGGLVAVGAATAVAVTLTGGNAPAPPAYVTLDDRAAVLAAAERAERQPTGRYWYSDVVQGQSYVMRPKTGTYAITAAVTETFAWWGAKTGMGEAYHGRDLPARPLTARDEALWRKAGSPSSFRVWSGDQHQTYTTKGTKWQGSGPERGAYPRGGGEFLGGRSVEDLRDLPTDPAALAEMFLSPEEMGRAAGVPLGHRAGADPARPESKMMRVASMLGGSPIPPKVRAGLVRALAAQPGVHAIGRVTDPLGRRGVALAADDRAVDADDGTFRSRSVIVFDERTGALLSRHEELTTPGGRYAEMRPGFIIDYWTVRAAGWTDTRPSPREASPFD